MVILLNPSACQGKALERWNKIRGEIFSLTGECDEVILPDPDAMAGEVRHRYLRGERRFIGAGGDGTINALVDALIRVSGEERLPDTSIGAVGIGSSNDFHKPVRPDQRRLGYPVRVDFRSVNRRDVVRIRIDTGPALVSRYFLLNASIGLTAQGNRIFNGSGGILRFFKRLHTSAAIVYAIQRAVVAHRNVDIGISVDGNIHDEYRISNVSLMKSPHITGKLRSSLQVTPDDGLIGLWIEGERTRFQLCRLFLSLITGTISPGATSWTGKYSSIGIRSRNPFLLEYDGETISCRRAEFSVLSGAIGVCRS